MPHLIRITIGKIAHNHGDNPKRKSKLRGVKNIEFEGLIIEDVKVQIVFVGTGESVRGLLGERL